MKIGLIDVDSHNFPNLPLMKISAFHKNRGDTVEWWNGLLHYDVVYKSKVFDEMYSRDNISAINADKVIMGGTGYDLHNALDDAIEHQYPDYSIYTQYSDTAYGFLSRGCPRACGFCIVSEKEGRVSNRVADLAEFWAGQRYIKLLDPNLLACKEHEKVLLQLVESKSFVDFTQGLDIRLVSADNIKLLNTIKTKALHFAWDDPNDDLIPQFIWFAEHTQIKNLRRRVVYVLTNFNSTHEQDLYRVNVLRDIGYNPYVMIFDKPNAPQITRDLQGWVNNRRIFQSTSSFEEYIPRKGG